MYVVIFDNKAIKNINKLPSSIKERIADKISSAKENPLHFFVRLVGMEQYKLRVGDYRVIADIDENTETIIILGIKHRKNVYERWIFQLMWWI